MAQLTEEQRRLLGALVGDAGEALRGGRAPDDVRADLLARGLSQGLAENVLGQAQAGLSAARPAVDLSRQVWVVRLPPDADPSELVAAPSMGTREEVAERIGQALPGTTFDAEGRGRFDKAGFVLEFELGAERTVNLLSLEIRGGGAALSAVRALALRTGWRVLDRSDDKLFDIPGLRPAEPPPPEPSTARVRRPEPRRTQPVPAAPAPPPPAPRRGRRVAAVAAVVVGVAAAGLALRGPRGIDANEAQALADVTQFATAENDLAAANLGGFVPPEVLADSSLYATLLGTGSPLGGLADPRFAEAGRSGYRFEFRPAPGSSVDEALVKPAFGEFVYVALPESYGSTGRRSFAYFSREGAIFARDDGRPPTPDDRPIERLR